MEWIPSRPELDKQMGSFVVGIADVIHSKYPAVWDKADYLKPRFVLLVDIEPERAVPRTFLAITPLLGSGCMRLEGDEGPRRHTPESSATTDRPLKRDRLPAIRIPTPGGISKYLQNESES